MVRDAFRRRPGSGWPALFSLLALSGSAVPSAAQQVPSAEVEPHTFETYGGDTVRAELGRFRVPVNRADPGRDSLTLAFVRFPATVEDPGPPIVYLAGGPGGSGIATARASRFPLFMAFRRFGDVIAFDQRGTGMSDGPVPDQCDLTREYPPSRPLHAAHLRHLALEVARECGRMWRERGVDFSAYDTEESADDVAALAAALAHEEIRLWAISYGTHLALATVRRHPELVERAILAGIEGPDHTVKLPSYWTRQLEAVEALVAADSAVESEFPDLTALVETVLRRLEREPARVEFVGPDGRDTLRSLVSRFEVETETIDRLRDPGSMVSVPFLYRRMASGDFSIVADASRTVGGLDAMPEAMDAASGLSEDRLFRFLREQESHLLGGGNALTNVYMADALGIPDLGPAFRAPVRSEVPTLFISGTLDGRTPVENAVEVLAGFPNGRHLVIENAGHSDPLFLSSPRILDVMQAFLAEEPLPTLRIRVAPPELSSGRLPPSLPPELVDRVVGAWEHAEGDVWRVLRQGTVRSLDAAGRETGQVTRLQMRVRGDGFPLEARPDTTFWVPFLGPGLVFRFPEVPEGRVSEMVLVRDGVDTTRFGKVDWDDVGFVDSRHWHATGPFRSSGEPICEPAFPPEAHALAGTLDLADRYPGAAGQVGWVPTQGDDGFVNLEESLGGSPVGGVGYAHLTIVADEPLDAQLRTGTDDDARLFLDGELVHAFDGEREAWEEQDTIPVTLRQGPNRLLVKLCNRDSDWRFNLRITDADGRSLVTSGERGRATVGRP